MTDAFVNQWRVTEYVFDADGTPIGVIRQQRHIERLDNGNLRVTQICTPDLTVPNHPMHEFAGEWVFVISVDGHQRRYLGPDVVGNGWAWGKDCITGRGIWPRFGHNFTSYGVMLSPTRQITGGQFFNVNQLVATIIGVAENTVEERYPTLVMDEAPHELSEIWKGTSDIYDQNGELLDESVFERHFRCDSYSDEWNGGDGFHIDLKPANGRDLVHGLMTGVSQKIGCARFINCWDYEWDTDAMNQILHLLDVESRQLVSIGYSYNGLNVNGMQVQKLST